MIEDPMARYSHEQGEQLGDFTGEPIVRGRQLEVVVSVGWDGDEMVILYGDKEIARAQDAGRMTDGEFGGWIAEHVIMHQCSEAGYSDAEREMSYREGAAALNRAFVASVELKLPDDVSSLFHQEAPEWTI